MLQDSLAGRLARPAHQNGWRIEALRDHRWLWLTAFVGANLLQSGFSGWCLLSNLLALSSRRKADHAS